MTESFSSAEAAGASIVPVLLSGGSGTRLWPLSRESFPKQLWPLVSSRTLLGEALVRAVGPGFAAPVIVCNEEHRFLIAEQARLSGVGSARILLEPEGRGSAPAAAAAAFLVAEETPEAVLWIMTSDAVIRNVAALQQALGQAGRAARAGHVVTFGVRPTAVETGYGYIAPGAVLAGLDGVRAVARFLEKPDAATAARLLDEGGYWWNSGMFVATAAMLIAEIERHAPAVAAAVQAAVAERRADLDFLRLDANAFRAAPSISFDHALAERSDRTAMVETGFDWSDVGSWDALWALGPHDGAGNVTVGDVLIESAANCYVRSDGVLTAVVGLKDTVVVVTQDAVLAMDRARAQEVKSIVARLKATGRAEAVAHNRTYRPWGFYETLTRGERFQVKRILVWPGHRMSLQKHFHRAEHWVVVHGTARVVCAGTERLVHENESVYVPPTAVHRLENPGRIPLTLIEVQSGSYLGEDDIVRLEDSYGRV